MILMDLCSPRTIRQLMEEYQIAFRKDYGQNFLINPAIPARIAESCCDERESVILEIGPGIGSLTRELASRYKKVVALEIDKGLIPVLKKTLADCDNVILVNEDVMKTDLKLLLEKETGASPVSVCANLPYYITTPILMKLLESGIPFDYITVMIQTEVADRLCASAGSPEYGAITAVLNYYGTAKRLFAVSAGNFMPAPKVGSTVIRIECFKAPPFELKDASLFFEIIKLAFGQRRKTLSNAISHLFPMLTKAAIGEIITTLGHRPDVRGERLSSGDFAALSNALYLAKNSVK